MESEQVKLFKQIFVHEDNTQTNQREANKGRLIPRYPKSKTESRLKHQKLDDMRLQTPDIFKEKTFINEGTFGKVYKAKINDNLFALKKIKVDSPDKGFPITSIREIKVLKKLADHPNIVKLVDIVSSKSNAVYLVFEFVEFDLYKLLRK